MTFLQIRSARIALAIILSASAIIASLSPLAAGSAFGSWSAVALGAFLSLGFHWYHDRAARLSPRGSRFTLYFSRLASSPPGLAGKRKARPTLLDLALLSQIAAGTTQALVAIRLPSSHLALHNTPGMELFYLLLAGTLAFLVIPLALCLDETGRCWTALLGAALFSSTLYLRSFAVPEAGPVYGPVLSLTLLAASAANSLRLKPRPSRITTWSLLFLAAVALAVLFSPVPGQSLDFWLRLAVLMSLAAILSSAVDPASRAWQTGAWATVLIAGMLPIGLAGVKLLSLIPTYGLLPALAYRWHPTELGGANLAARSILCVVPLALALARLSSRGRVRWVRYAVLAGGVGVIIYARSWEGFFAWLIALAVYALLVRWHGIATLWRKFSHSRAACWMVASGITLSLALVMIAVLVAPVLNIYSFNGRLIHWHAALLAWRDHPWLGGGPANEMLYTPYAQQVHLFAENQALLDDPLFVIRANAGDFVRVHAHNLFLEIGAGTGIVGLVMFVGLLVAILLAGFRAWWGSLGAPRLWIAACLAGIAGALAWGMLDVLWVTPPFFSFPVWALIGLLLAATRATWVAEGAHAQPAILANESLAKDGGGTTLQIPKFRENSPRLDKDDWLPVARQWSLVVLATLIVLIPALTSVHYASGFEALQEHRWPDAVASLERATHYAPIAARPQGLLAQAYLQQGDMERAATAYQRASQLRGGFSPDINQLGWLAWFQGDMDLVGRYFEQAIESDPGQLWHDGLYADLGLAYATEGRYSEALQLFKQGIELNPSMAPGSAWISRQSPAGKFDLVLDPAYGRDEQSAAEPEDAGAATQGARGSTDPLQTRIRAHLGQAGFTSRLFHLPATSASPTLSYSEVLDAVEADYRAARVTGSRDAPLNLAALAEASRRAGFHHRAELAYLEFQTLQADSAYGYRDLGLLYRAQGRQAEAQAMLERAAEVSPRDFASRYHLAQAYLDLGQRYKAEAMLEVIGKQSLTTLFHSHLFDADLHTTWARLYKGNGDLDLAAMAMRRAGFTTGSPSAHLAMAGIYRQMGQLELAAEKCVQAAEALLQAWPQPLAPELWATGVCLTGSQVDPLPPRILALARQQPLSGSILLGHTFRGWGQWEQALAAYQRAVAAYPEEGGPHFFLGETYQGLGQVTAAETEYRLAADLDPQESLPLLALGRLEWSQGQQQAAVESFRSAVQVTPGWSQAHVALGNALLALGNREGAAQQYQRAQMADGDLSEGLVYDFAGRLTEANIRSPGPDHVRNDHFVLDGNERRVLFMHPPSRATYRLTLPRLVPQVEGTVPATRFALPRAGTASTGASPLLAGATEGELLFIFDLATAPESWHQSGDGVTFAIYVESDQGTEQVFSTYIDPKQDLAARRWHPQTADLSAYAGQTVSITLETDAGPAGDDRYDWAGWGVPQLLIR